MKPELRKFMRAKAHSLKPVVITGQNGVSPAVLNEIDLALEHHELIKVRVNAGDREDRRAMIQQICTDTSAELIQTIGHVVTLYRKTPSKH